MVARPGQYQASFNSGELAPNLWGRSDIKQFYSAARLMQNVEPVPQGGFDLMPGTREAGQVRSVLESFGHAGAPGLSAGPHAAPGVIYETSFPYSLVSIVDVIGLTASAALYGGVEVQLSLDGVTWFGFGPRVNLTTVARNRRVAAAPGSMVGAAHLRLVLVEVPPAPLTFALGSIALARETGLMVEDARQFEHTFSDRDAFTIVFVPFHADIWKGDTFVGAVSTPITAAMLPRLSREQRLDAMILLHNDLQPYQIRREDTDYDWSAAPAPFENMPLVDYGAAYGNLVDDVWGVTLNWSAGPVGLALEISVNGETAPAVNLTAGPDWTAFADDVKAAIESLPSVAPGISVNAVAGTGDYASLTIGFSGTGNSGQRFAVVPRITNATWAAAVASHLTFGDPGGEALGSAGRGWPGSGTFFQDSLYLAGFKSQSGAVLKSVSGEYFDLNTKLENPAGAVLFRIDANGAERIEHVTRSKHLVIFTNEAEYYVSDRAIVRGTPPNVPQSSRNGSAANIRPVESEGSLLYVGKSRSIVYAASFSDVSQSYESEPISLLASHLVRAIKAGALQRSSESTDAARFFMVRDDGLMLVGVMIRNQEVMGFVRFVTAGQVRDVCVDGANVPYLLVERQVGGARRLMRERVTSEALMHQERLLSFEAPVSRVTGLATHDGAEVWAMLDGYAHGPLLVTDGAIDLPWPASTVIVGRWTPPIAQTLPVPRLVGERVVLQRPVRVHTVRAHVLDTTSIAIGANGRTARDQPLIKAGQVSNQPVQPTSGPVAVAGLLGWSDEGTVEITQVRPGRLQVRSLTVEARI